MMLSGRRNVGGYGARLSMGSQIGISDAQRRVTARYGFPFGLLYYCTSSLFATYAPGLQNPLFLYTLMLTGSFQF